MYYRSQIEGVIAPSVVLSAAPWAEAPEPPLEARASGATPETTRAEASATAQPGALSDEAYKAIRQFYQYDEQMPLDARVVEREETPGYVREKVVFNGIRDSRVPGYLGLPKAARGPYPCILLIDGITGSKSRWWEEESWPHGGLATRQLLAAGFAVLALDAQYHGERSAANDCENPGAMYFERKWYSRTREMILATTVDHRRAIDYLATRPEIDIERIGLLGHSMGGIVIFGLNASEPRAKASVACVTPLSIWGPKELAVIPPFDFARGVGKRPFLLLMGRSDRYYSAADVVSLMEMIEGAPKKLSFYDSGHRLPKEYVTEAREWFERHLK
jgi:dienelactone hydrolase